MPDSSNFTGLTVSHYAVIENLAVWYGANMITTARIPYIAPRFSPRDAIRKDLAEAAIESSGEDYNV